MIGIGISPCLDLDAGSAAGLQSDDFENGSLAPFWTFVDPLGDCSVAETAGEAQITLPGTQTHDLWVDAHTAPRIWQDIPDADIDVALELAAAPIAISWAPDTQRALSNSSSHDSQEYTSHLRRG